MSLGSQYFPHPHADTDVMFDDYEDGHRLRITIDFPAKDRPDLESLGILLRFMIPITWQVVKNHYKEEEE